MMTKPHPWFLCAILICAASGSAYALNTDRMRIAFVGQDYDACIAEGERLLAGAGYSKDLDQLYYLLALSYLKAGNYLRASDIFEIILKEFKDSKYREGSLVGLGDAYFLKADYAKARGFYDELLKKNPATKYAACVYYRISQCAFKTGDTNRGNEYACKLKGSFPLSLEGRVNADVACPLTSYSVQVGSFSNSRNANNLLRRLNEQGYRAYLEQPAGGGKMLYRVRVGKVRTQQEAAGLAEKLSRQGYSTTICP